MNQQQGRNIRQPTLGILGAGQLAKMLSEAAKELGYSTLVYDPKPDACAFVDNPYICAEFTNGQELKKFADQCQLVTCEFENVPATVMKEISKYTSFFPSPHAFAIASNRLKEKDFFSSIGLEVPLFQAIKSPKDIEKLRTAYYPLIVKTASGGYDGKGQATYKNYEELKAGITDFTRTYIAESKVDFDHELAILVARNQKGETSTYPAVAIFQHQGILHLAISVQNHPLKQQAQQHAINLARKLDYVGVLALEMFVKDSQLLGNEFAPRVHNSGHLTIEGSATSQFSQHIRAIADMPLSSVKPAGNVVMQNLIGDVSLPEYLKEAGYITHLYGKTPMPGRKVGHITLTQLEDESDKQFLARNGRLYQDLYGLELPQQFTKFCCPKATTGAVSI